MAIQLGSRVRDSITGADGIAVARTEYLYGCVRVGIEAESLDEKGKPRDLVWIDEQRIELLEERTPVASRLSSATAGGPQEDPPRW